MKLTLPRAALAKALDFVARVTERRATIPIITNIRLQAAGGKLTLSATDLDIEAQASIDADIATEGETTVGAATLHDIVCKLAADTVSFDLGDASDNNGRLTVKAGRAKFQLATLPATDWPTLERGDLPHKFSLPAETVARALRQTAFAISTEETRYYLMGTYLHSVPGVEGPMLRFVASNGHTLARVEMIAPSGSSNLPGVTVPRKTCGELSKLAESLAKDKSPDPIHFEIGDSKILIHAGETTILSKLIDGSFPDYTRIIPAQNETIALLTRAELEPAIARVATISGERGRAVKMSFAPDKLTVSVTNADVGTASEEVKSDYDAAPIEIGFNANYLTRALSALDADAVRIEFNDGCSPTLIRSAPDAALLIVIMPMRV